MALLPVVVALERHYLFFPVLSEILRSLLWTIKLTLHLVFFGTCLDRKQHLLYWSAINVLPQTPNFCQNPCILCLAGQASHGVSLIYTFVATDMLRSR